MNQAALCHALDRRRMDGCENDLLSHFRLSPEIPASAHADAVTLEFLAQASHLIPDFTWQHALVFAALLSAP